MMKLPFLLSLTFLITTVHAVDNVFEHRTIHRRDDCIDPDPSDTLTDRLNTALNSSGPGFILQLCPNTEYQITSPILFASPNQEISTVGYPTGDDRAVITVSGSNATDGTGQTTAVDGTCSSCDGVKLRNIQINGTRNGAAPLDGGGNIEFGGDNADQLIEYVHSFDPRSWTCMHIAEGPFTCNNVTVQNNDVGPCGSEAFQQWADGISVSCQNAVVRNNMINNPTDGGIVIFGSPGTQVYNNTIWVETQTLLGGINMVDYDPWNGNYTGTVVQNNTIMGGFSTDSDTSSNETLGANTYDVIIKIGIAIGPRTWFGDEYGDNVSTSGTVLDNQLTGAFGYGIAISSAQNFTVENNVLIGNTTFIGAVGPNCSSTDTTPTPAPFVMDQSTIDSSNIQSDFQSIPDGNSLTCILPPEGGDYWPFGGNPSNSSTSSSTSPSASPSSGTPTSSSGSAGHTAGLIVGIIAGIIFVGALAWFVRRWALARQNPANNRRDTRGFVRSKEPVPY